MLLTRLVEHAVNGLGDVGVQLGSRPRHRRGRNRQPLDDPLARLGELGLPLALRGAREGERELDRAGLLRGTRRTAALTRLLGLGGLLDSLVGLRRGALLGLGRRGHDVALLCVAGETQRIRTYIRLSGWPDTALTS